MRPFDLQPTLIGDLVTLRPLRADDFDALFAVAADPLIWAQHPDSNRHEEQTFRAFFRDALESGGALIVSDRRDGRVIGSSRFHGYDAERNEVEIGWTFLARSHWGGRHNSEMKRLMLRHAFQFVQRVVFLVGPANRRSQRALEKIGAVRAGLRRGRDGRESVVYEITAAGLARQTRLTTDMRAVIEAAHLCFAATVTPEGRPNVSPKGTVRVWDDTHLFFLDIASPGTRANLAHTPWIELNVVDQLSRRGYRFTGPAKLHLPDSPEYAEAIRRIYGDPPPAAPPIAAVLLTIERAAALLSPAYWSGLDETALRALWRERRLALDEAFEQHLVRVGPVRVNGPAA